jgi:hypothetical protein
MTWIKTVPLSEASESLLQALESQRPLYPKNMQRRCFGPTTRWLALWRRILIPDALNHAISTFGVLMSADLPLPAGSTK